MIKFISTRAFKLKRFNLFLNCYSMHEAILTVLFQFGLQHLLQLACCCVNHLEYYYPPRKREYNMYTHTNTIFVLLNIQL